MRRAGRRLIGVIPTLLLTWTLVFAALQAMPGDPVALMLGGTPTSEEVIAAERARLGLDRPIAVQYIHFLGGALRGDFGESFRSRQPVMGLIAEQLPATLSLALGGLVFGAGAGIVLGVLAGPFPYGWIDTAIMTVALAGVSLPGFWVTMLLIQVFSTSLGWLPVLGTGFWALGFRPSSSRSCWWRCSASGWSTLPSPLASPASRASPASCAVQRSA